jgi:hypothetical protein
MRRNKYNNIPTIIHGIKFPSKREAARYSELVLLQTAKKIDYFLRQVPFYLPGGVIYRVDFQIFYPDGHVRYEDVKGYETQIFKIKKKLVESLYPVRIELV